MALSLLVRLALFSLSRNKLRSLLTVLGVVIGVAAVVSIMSIGEGASQELGKKVASLGVNTVHVHAGSDRRGGVRGTRGSGIPLEVRDWQMIKGLPGVLRSCPMVEAEAQLVGGSANWSSKYVGTSLDFFAIRDWPVVQGRLFSEPEVSTYAKVGVLGVEVAEKLFGSSSPIGESVRVGNLPVKIVGVLERKGENSLSSSPDNLIVIPYTTALRHLRRARVLNYISAQVSSAGEVEPVQNEIIARLNQRHSIRDKDRSFQAYNQVEIDQLAQDTTRDMVNFLTAVASVSLVVGGVGIMNIMLVTVTERRREIGIRMAVGATGSNIRSQFLIEAVVLACIGGLLGIVLGIVLATKIAEYSEWPAVFTVQSLVLGFSYAVAMGIVSGFYPALRASRMDPIEALTS